MQIRAHLDDRTTPYHYNCRTITVAYWETPAEIAAPDDTPDPAANLDRWKREAYNRDNLTRKEVAALIDHAKGAKWPHTKVVRGHYRKHQRALGLKTSRISANRPST